MCIMALIDAAEEDFGVTLRSGVILMGNFDFSELPAKWRGLPGCHVVLTEEAIELCALCGLEDSWSRWDFILHVWKPISGS